MSENEAVPTAGTVEAPVRKLGLVKAFGVIGIIFGILFVVVGTVAWAAVSSQLTAENITIPDDADYFAGQQVTGPLTAYVQAETINKHSLEMADGKTYAELPMDDPTRAVVMDGSFLRASLFTSVVAFGVALFAVGVGVLSILFGWAFIKIAGAPVVVKQSAIASS